jgi:hypothetical protein
VVPETTPRKEPRAQAANTPGGRECDRTRPPGVEGRAKENGNSPITPRGGLAPRVLEGPSRVRCRTRPPYNTRPDRRPGGGRGDPRETPIASSRSGLRARGSARPSAARLPYGCPPYRRWHPPSGLLRPKTPLGPWTQTAVYSNGRRDDEAIHPQQQKRAHTPGTARGSVFALGSLAARRCCGRTCRDVMGTRACSDPRTGSACGRVRFTGTRTLHMCDFPKATPPLPYPRAASAAARSVA